MSAHFATILQMIANSSAFVEIQVNNQLHVDIVDQGGTRKMFLKWTLDCKNRCRYSRKRDSICQRVENILATRRPSADENFSSKSPKTLLSAACEAGCTAGYEVGCAAGCADFDIRMTLQTQIVIFWQI